jgi:hypothetical protein
MNTVTFRLGIHRIASLALFCFSLSACTAMACGEHTTTARIADAGAICRDTMGLSPSNVPYDSCVQSLLQNSDVPDQPGVPAGQIATLDLPGALAETDTQKSCARWGLKPGSSAFETCTGNLSASLFEAADAGAR